jgi:hypothetical protein
MASQIKFGYTYWQSPEMEAMPAVHEVLPRAGGGRGAARGRAACLRATNPAIVDFVGL